MNDKPRYSRISDILQLLVLMQSKVMGVTIQDIMDEFNISRRTAERMRDSVLNIFPQIDEIECNDRFKRWGFTGGYMNSLVYFTPEELSNLVKLKNFEKEQNHEVSANLVKSTISKIKALSRKSNIELDNRIEILMQTEGYAIKQMPKNKVPVGFMQIIRDAILSGKKVESIYKDKKRILSPLGIIYGEKAFLIALEDNKESEPRTYILHKFLDLKLTDIDFDRNNFDLNEYSKQSFGVYHGEIYDVKLNFKKEFASEVLNYNFHPTQKMKVEEDGSVIVKFKASGEMEILWHLFKWGDSVKIVSPKKLKDTYKNMLEKVLEHQN